MLRVVFTVALAVVVLGVATPAVEHAGVQRSDAQVRDAVDAVRAEARSLAAAEHALPAGQRPARRTLQISLPSGGFASAPVRSVSVGAPPSATAPSPGIAGAGTERGSSPAATRFAWRVAGGTRHVVRVDGIRIRASAPAGLQLAGGGEFRLVLRLVERDGERVVLVAREG